ncbi:hypothetical protein DFH09DRAFT_1334655 [Mycena vulgaris]|nr:hypothetical protein DFH09DRAFT_1334655 [Mycena vulgaris]
MRRVPAAVERFIPNLGHIFRHITTPDFPIFFADSHGSWRWADARHKHPGVKEMLLGDARDFVGSEKWYTDRGIPFRRWYLLHGVPGSGTSSLIHVIAGELMLDIYVVLLLSAWISDSVLMGLMGRVPKDARERGESAEDVLGRAGHRLALASRWRRKEGGV